MPAMRDGALQESVKRQTCLSATRKNEVWLAHEGIMLLAMSRRAVGSRTPPQRDGKQLSGFFCFVIIHTHGLKKKKPLSIILRPAPLLVRD